MNFEQQKFSDLEIAKNKTMRIINETESGLINLNNCDNELGYFGLKIEKYSENGKNKYLITSKQAGKEVYLFAQKIVEQILSREITIDENIREK